MVFWYFELIRSISQHCMCVVRTLNTEHWTLNTVHCPHLRRSEIVQFNFFFLSLCSFFYFWNILRPVQHGSADYWLVICQVDVRATNYFSHFGSVFNTRHCLIFFYFISIKFIVLMHNKEFYRVGWTRHLIELEFRRTE